MQQQIKFQDNRAVRSWVVEDRWAFISVLVKFVYCICAETDPIS